jgi:hypothetical protein
MVTNIRGGRINIRSFGLVFILKNSVDCFGRELYGFKKKRSIIITIFLCFDCSEVYK